MLRTDGEFVGGIVVLDDGDRVYRWQGGVRVDGYDFPANDLLDWHVMTDALDRGVAEYDLVGADNERISEYKAKFGPVLFPVLGNPAGLAARRRVQEIQRLPMARVPVMSGAVPRGAFTLRNRSTGYLPRRRCGRFRVGPIRTARGQSGNRSSGHDVQVRLAVRVDAADADLSLH